MKKYAFTLIELLMYMSIVSLLTFFVFDYWNTVHKSMIPHIEVPRIGLEVLRRDLIQASNLSSEWSSGTTELVFKKKRIDHNGAFTTFSVGWRIDKKRFVRSNGIYDFHTGRWLERRSAVVSKDAQLFTWKYSKSSDGGRVEVIEVTSVAEKSEPVHVVVRLRNKVLI